MNYQTLFFSKIEKDVAKCVVCCNCDWRFKGKVVRCIYSLTLLSNESVDANGVDPDQTNLSLHCF